MLRHFAFFSQHTGECVREWVGPVAPYRPRWWHYHRQRALDRWATQVSQPQRGEIGLDVTQFGWPVGDFRYCSFDMVDRRLEWGPPRQYIEVREVQSDRLAIVANQESHRPIRATSPGHHVLDITGTGLAPLHGRIFGHFVCRDGRWALEPLPDERIIPAPTQRALAEAPIDLDLVMERVAVKERVAV